MQALRYENHEEILRCSKIPALGGESGDEKEGEVLKMAEGKAVEPSSSRSQSRPKRSPLGSDDIPWKVGYFFSLLLLSHKILRVAQN